jgi:zinc protease
MRKITTIALSLLMCSLAVTEAAAVKMNKPLSLVKAATTAKDTEHYFTSNGIEVILKKITTNDIIGLKLFLKGGSRNLTEKNAGIEKLLLNTMLEGSREFPKDKLNLEMAKIGAQVDTASFFDFSNFSMKSLGKYFDRAFYIFQTLINNPLLDAQEVELGKNKMLSEVKHSIDDPDEFVWKIVNKTYLAGHPYANDFSGELTTIPNISKADLESYKKENLVGSKMLLVIAGNYKAGIKKDIEKYFSKIPKGNYVNTPVKPVIVEKSTVTVEDRDIPTAYIASRFSAPAPKDKDYPAMYLGLKILSEKLGDSIRTKHGLSYAVYSGSSQRQANSGYLYVTTVKPKETMELMYEEIAKAKKNLVDKKTLEGVRNLYYTQYFINLEPNLSQADTLGFNQLITGDYNNGYKLIEKFKKVTPEEIKAAMNKYVKNIHFAVIYKKDLIDQSLFTKL